MKVVVMMQEGKVHPDEDALEGYALGALPEEKVADLEEHLLVCQTCRLRLSASDAYILSMRRASARVRSEAQEAAPPAGKSKHPPA